MTFTKGVIRIIRDNPQMIFTPKILQYEALKRDIPITYENAKKILQRFAQRGIVQRLERGQYIFSPKGDTLSQSKGQKGTNLRGVSLSPESRIAQAGASDERDMGTYHISENEIPLFRRMLAVCTSEKLKYRTISPKDFVKGIYLRGIGNPETKRRYFYRLKEMGVFVRVSRGRYRVDVELARNLIEGTPPGVNHSDEKRDIIVVSHHFRIKKAIPLEKEEYERVAKYLWSRDIIKDYVNGVYLEVYPTGSGDRSHGVSIRTLGATFHVTYSYRKHLAKVMIYPRNRESWPQYATAIFGESFTRRAIKIGISSHLGFNLGEISQILYQGDNIRVTFNRSDFGSSGDLEFEDVSQDTASYIKMRVLGKVESIAREADVLEGIRRAIDEITVRLHMLESERTELDELKNEIGKIREHMIEHSRALTLLLKGMGSWGGDEGVEGYA